MADKWTLEFYVQALAADTIIRWTPPHGATLIHVSAVCTDAVPAPDTQIKIGTASDDEAYLAASNVGGSGTPAEFDYNDFATYTNKAYPALPAGQQVLLTVDVNLLDTPEDLTVVLTLLDD